MAPPADDAGDEAVECAESEQMSEDDEEMESVPQSQEISMTRMVESLNALQQQFLDRWCARECKKLQELMMTISTHIGGGTSPEMVQRRRRETATVLTDMANRARADGRDDVGDLLDAVSNRFRDGASGFAASSQGGVRSFDSATHT